MHTPLVSVVMSVFNGARFLREAIESILLQSFSDFEFIIINDGSIDKTGPVLDEYRRRDPRVRVYHRENRGLISSLNYGCELAKGKYIARMDADDIALRDRFLWQIDFMETHPGVAVLGTAVEFVDQTGKGLRISCHPSNPREIRRILLEKSFMWHPSVVMRKSAFFAVGGYRDVPHAEDYDLWLRIADHFQIANLEAVLLKYRLHPEQVSVSKCAKQAMSTAAAKAAALARRNGEPDPLGSVNEISPSVLARLGVSSTVLQTTLARGYLSTIRNMCDIGEYGLALKMFESILIPAELQFAEAWTVADLRLCASEIYWHQTRFYKCIVAAAQAVITRPAILGRLLKPVLASLA
jgi:Glycosyl transferase family 2